MYGGTLTVSANAGFWSGAQVLVYRFDEVLTHRSWPSPSWREQRLEERRRSFNAGKGKRCAPCPLKLASAPPSPRQIDLTPCPRRLEQRPRWSAKERRPYRARHKARAWERER